MNSTPEEAAKELALTPVQERLDLTEAVLLVLRGANVRKFNNSRSSFKKSGTQKPHSVFMRIAQNEEWILVLTWQEKHGVVVSVSDDLFDAEFQGSR